MPSPQNVVVSVNGEIVSRDEASVSIFDHGFLFGDSVYEVLRTYRRVPFAVDEHLCRLEQSASQIGLTLPLSREGFKKEVDEVVGHFNGKSGGSEAYIRLIVTRGEGALHLDPKTCENSRRYMIVAPLSPACVDRSAPALKLRIVKRIRNALTALSPNIKSGSYLNNVLAFAEARRLGADDAIFLNQRGHLAEGTTFNVFFLHRGVLKTPALSCGILSGITRSQILGICEAHEIQHAEGNFRREDILASEEAFVTSTTRGVVPVGAVDEHAFRLAPGPITEKVRAHFAQMVRGEA